MLRRKILPGDRFGRLVVIRKTGRLRNTCLYECRCDCGNVKVLPSGNLTKAKSCGCINKNRIKHDAAIVSLRCRINSCNKKYTLTKEDKKSIKAWSGSYETFAKWLKDNGYTEGKTVVRKDVTKPFTIDNSYVEDKATAKKIMNRPRKFVEYNGEHIAIKDLAVKYGIKRTTLYMRISSLGWSLEDAIAKKSRIKSKNPLDKNRE